MSLQIVAGGGSRSRVAATRASSNNVYSQMHRRKEIISWNVLLAFSPIFRLFFSHLLSLRLPVATCCWYIISHFFSSSSLVLNTYVYACAPCAIFSAQTIFPSFILLRYPSTPFIVLPIYVSHENRLWHFNCVFGTAFFSLYYLSFFHISRVQRCW